jgi:hypothetical protein
MDSYEKGKRENIIIQMKWNFEPLLRSYPLTLRRICVTSLPQNPEQTEGILTTLLITLTFVATSY